MPKPKEGQSQSDYMEECMHEMSKGDRTNEQNVAACMQGWRDEHGGKKPADKDMAHYLAMWKRLLASPAYRKKIEVMNTSTPAAGESEESFMQRCTKELTGGASGVSDREAADACRLTWGNINAAPAQPGQTAPAMAQSGERAAKVRRIIARFKEKYGDDPGPALLKAMEPEPDESREDFMDRCLEAMGDREDADDICGDAWDDAGDDDDRRDESAGGIVHKLHSTAGQEKEFILSDATPDRFGDIVEVEGWEFASFNRNPIALFNHNANFPVGSWANIRVGDKALRGDLILAPKGISPRIDEIRGLVEAGILRAVSVGFKPVASRPVDATKNDPFGMAPQIYTKAELVECSLVSIPANPNALAVAKSLNISAETQKMVFAEHGNKRTVRRSASSARARAEHGNKRASAPSPAEYGRTHSIIRGQSMLLGKRIEEGEKFIVRLRDQLQDHLAHVDDQNPDDAGMAVTEELTTKIALAERNLKSLKDAEARLGNGGDGGNGSDTRTELMASTAFRQADRQIAERMGKPDYGPRPFGLAPKKIDAVDFLIRQGVIEAYRKVKGIDVDAARQLIYGNDECTRAYLDYATKAASNMAQTAVTGWAAELVQQVYGDFLQILVPTSVMPNLANLGLALTFGRAGRIVIPSRSATPSLAGSFVGEGQPIPVRQGAFTTQTLVPK
ncbi:MAG TPA: HK97 family phage prohead protease, partial [Candidatus Cybelea sp.]|nr:HK97 family phage prohead protease [Candidatus Cybelea sp.]